MCLCISTPDGGKTELTFVQEQILLKKNGSRDVRVDLLIKNSGNTDIQRFRIELPCRLLTDADLSHSDGNESEEQSYTRLCHEQCDKVRIATTKLTARDAPHNWIYRILPHISLGDYNPNTGHLAGTRDESDQLMGLVKHDWKIAVSRELGDDPMRWFACYCNGITVVDYVVPPERPKEFLRSQESMWISVEFAVPQGGTQYVQMGSIWRRVLGRERSFPVILMSPKAFLEWRTNQLTIFGRRTRRDDTKTKVAVAHVKNILGKPGLPDICDWRLFLHWSKRISISRTKISGDVVEPPIDHILKADNASWFSFRREPAPSSDFRSEFWFGGYHKAAEPAEGICIELKATVSNLMYSYLFPWLGVIGFILGVLGLSLAIHRWIDYLHTGKG